MEASLFVLLASVLSVAGLAFAAGQRFFGRLGGIAAAVLFALSPFLIYYSTEARMFALAGLLALLALYLAHRALDDRRWWLAVGATLALGMWNYYYAAFIFLPVGVLALTSADSVVSACSSTSSTTSALLMTPSTIGRSNPMSSRVPAGSPPSWPAITSAVSRTTSRPQLRQNVRPTRA